MEKFDPIDIEFLINNAELKADAKKAKDDIQGIGDTAEATAARIGGKGGKGGIAPPLDRAGEAAERAGRKAAASRPQWNGLGNSINQISRELPAFTYSAQTGFLALSNNIPILADEISRLKSQNEALIASGQKGVPVWKQVVKGLFSWQTALSLGIAAITIFGPKLFEFFSSLSKGSKDIDSHAKSLEALNKAYESSDYKRVIKDMTELRSLINLAKDGLVDKKVALDKYNETLGTAYRKTDDLNEAERIMVEKAPAYIEAMLYKAAATQAMDQAATDLVENQKKILELEEERIKPAKEIEEGEAQRSIVSSRSGFADPHNRIGRVKDIDKELDELEKTGNEIIDKSQKIVDDFNEKAAKIGKDAGLNIFGGEDAAKDAEKEAEKLKREAEKQQRELEKLLGVRKDLLEKVVALDREYARKQLDRDEEELQALRDKFTKARELIQEFNRDPKNAQYRIDLGDLKEIQEGAEADLIYKQETRTLKEELEKQKKLYEEIEEFKSKFGIQKTKEKYGEELKQFQNYAAVIRQMIANNQNAFSAVAGGSANGGQNERVRLLEAAKEEELRATRENHLELLEEYMSYQEKRKLLIEKFDEEYSALILSKNFDEAEERKRKLEEELNSLDDANLKKKDAYKRLFSDMGRLTIEAGRSIISDAKKLLETEAMSAETRAKILKLIAETEAEITDMKEEKILKIAHSLGELGYALQQIGDDIGSTSLSNIGAFLSTLANGVDDLMAALKFDDEVDNLEKLQTGIKALVQIIGMVASASARRKAAEEQYYLSVIGLQNDYNLSIQEQIRLQSILSENVFIKDYEGRITDANKALISANQGFQDALEKLDEGRAKIGQRNAVDWGSIGQGAASGAALGATIGSVVPVIGNIIGGIVGGIGGALVGLFGGKKKKDRFGDLLTEYPELLQKTEDGVLRVNQALAESLIENDMLDKATKQIVQNVLDWQKALDEARAQIREVITDLTGSLSDDLRNALVDAFRSGEDAAIAMGDTVEKVLENILSNMIFNEIFNEAFSTLQDSMADSYDLNGDRTWVDDFSRFFNEASGLTDDFNQALRDAQNQAAAFGFDVFNPEEDQNKPAGLQGAIRRELTEETASELTGLFRGQYDITKRHFQLHEKHFELEQRNFETTRNIMQISSLIEQNTAATVVQLVYVVSELKTISKQTKSGQSSRDMGKG